MSDSESDVEPVAEVQGPVDFSSEHRKVLATYVEGWMRIVGNAPERKAMVTDIMATLIELGEPLQTQGLEKVCFQRAISSQVAYFTYL